MIENFEVICWPDIQDYMDKKGFNQHAELINSERGLDLYGSSAYLVDKEWAEKVDNGLIEDDDREYNDDVLVVNYEFPYDDEEEE